MKRLTLAGILAAASCVLTCARASAADDATMFRVFLNDGNSLVSYGEIARVADHVVFSMPIGSTANSPLQLVNIAANRIDWDRTDRYAATARSMHYFATQGENDFAALSNQIAQTLNDVTLTTDAARRLALVEQARKALADWPAIHFNYRGVEVQQMVAMLDEAIADLRAATGRERFDLNLVAYANPVTITEPLLPDPTPKEAIEQTIMAAWLSESSAERVSLLGAALAELDRSAPALPSAWLVTTRDATRAAIESQLQIDRAYQSLTTQIMDVATQRARLGDVRGLERMIAQIHQRDAALGGSRPDAVNALIAAVEDRLDAARRLQLARDRWALRAPEFRKYWSAISTPVDLFARLKPSLEDIRGLAGSSPESLAAIDRIVARIVKTASTVAPPEELGAAHALLVSAAQMADNAARIRREAIMSGDLARAWDASSAAAGALMLGARARDDIQALLRQPELR